MKTAIELAEDKPSSIDDDLYAWATEAAAMLCQQAEQIEALIKERDDVYVQSLQFGAENKELKADAERYQWYVAQLESGNLDKLEEAFRNMERVEIVTKQMFDAAIDAMKGKS